MKLSIIIPVYNNYKNLSTLLENLNQQTVINNAEIIIVDDGSSPPLTRGVLTEGCADNLMVWTPCVSGEKIQLFSIQHSGAATARNYGFSKSSGDYIFFCDADIVFLKNNALEKMIQILEHNPNQAYCYSSFKFGWKTFECGKFDAEKLKHNNFVSTMSMIRREAILTAFRQVSTENHPKGCLNFPFDPKLKRFQDWDLWLTLLNNGHQGIWLNEILWQSKSDGTISKWLPEIFYKLPFLKSVKEFEKAKKIVKKKHNL